MARCRRRRALFGSERPGGKRGALLSRLTLIVLLLLLPVEGGAQSTDTVETPRTPWGTPDLRGVWINSTLTPLERPIELGDREFYTKASLAPRPILMGIGPFGKPRIFPGGLSLFPSGREGWDPPGDFSPCCRTRRSCE